MYAELCLPVYWAASVIAPDSLSTPIPKDIIISEWQPNGLTPMDHALNLAGYDQYMREHGLYRPISGSRRFVVYMGRRCGATTLAHLLWRTLPDGILRDRYSALKPIPSGSCPIIDVGGMTAEEVAAQLSHLSLWDAWVLIVQGSWWNLNLPEGVTELEIPTRHRIPLSFPADPFTHDFSRQLLREFETPRSMPKVGQSS